MANESESEREALEHCDSMSGPAVEYSIDRTNGIVFTRLRGKIAAAGIQGYAQQLREDPQFVPTLSEVVDLREVEELQITPADAITLADRADPFALTSRRAFITGNVSQTNWVQVHRMLRSPAENHRIFEGLESAKEWIGASDPTATAKKSARILPFVLR